MPSYNKCILIGHLTRDPQLKHLPGDTVVCECGLAVNHKRGEREEVCFVDFSVFGRQAESLNQYCQKGAAVLVEGRLKLDQWEDRQSGAKRSKHTIVADAVRFMGGKPQEEYPRDRKSLKGPLQVDPISDEQVFDESEIPF